MQQQSPTYVFNQYYWDLLKRTKDGAKAIKETSKEARDALRSLKKNYLHFDKQSAAHIDFFQSQCGAAFDAFTDMEASEWETHLAGLPTECCLFKDIPFRVANTLNSPYIMVQYFSFMGAMTVADVNVDQYIAILKNMGDTSDEWQARVDALPERLKTLIGKIGQYQEHAKSSSSSSPLDGLKDLEDTSLGKLAKEIMDEVDLTELQNTFMPGADGGAPNILEMLQNPNGGISKLLSTVSSKMVSKLSSGELSQESLLQDAVSFASKLPNMMPQGMGDMGGMLKNFMGGMGGAGGAGGMGGAGKSGGGFDFSMMQNMMQMMGGMSGMPSPASMKHASNKMNHEMRRQSTADKLRHKMKDRRKNVDGHVEEKHE